MLASAGRASTVGIEFAICVVGCLLAGWWADGKLGTDPILTLIGLFVGSCAGFRSLYKAAKQMQAQAEEAERKDRESVDRGEDTDEL